MTDWKDIASAPKDGRHFLAWFPEGDWNPDDEDYERPRIGMAAVTFFDGS